MEIAKALILAGPGADDGRWARTRGSSAALFPIANRPILFHSLEALREAGVLEAAIVCGGATGEAIRDAVGDGRRWQLSVRYLDGEAAPAWAPRSPRRAASSATSPCSCSRGARCCASTCTPTSRPSRASNSTCSSSGCAGCDARPTS